VQARKGGEVGVPCKSEAVKGHAGGKQGRKWAVGSRAGVKGRWQVGVGVQVSAVQVVWEGPRKVLSGQVGACSEVASL